MRGVQTHLGAIGYPQASLFGERPASRQRATQIAHLLPGSCHHPGTSLIA